MNQRWLLGRHLYRPAEPIRTAEYDVGRVAYHDAKEFVRLHHYERSFPSSRFRFGLFRRGRLVGVAVFGVACRPEVVTAVFQCDAQNAVELSRFCLLDEVPGNGETWTLARCFDELRRAGMGGVVSFSDPVPRTAIDGRVVMPGHVGTIYAAHNAVYLGRGTSRTELLLSDGTLLSARALSKIRGRDKGCRYAAARLEAFGASALGREDPREWLRHWLPRLTRKFRHPGRHKYAWALDKRLLGRLPASRPYPKMRDLCA